jgi:hypothetical protein
VPGVVVGGLVVAGFVVVAMVVGWPPPLTENSKAYPVVVSA